MKLTRLGNKTISLEMEGNEIEVFNFGPCQAEVIKIIEGAKRINNESFTVCCDLKELHLPKSIEYIGDRIFQSSYSEVKIIYDGTKEDFQKIDYEREKYVSGGYDRYPYYSDYGASSELQRFYRRYGDTLMYCEVYCKKDHKTLIFGKKQN